MTGTVFVTVGTTKFDELIQTAYQENILHALKEKGYSKVIYQIGRGIFEPLEDTKCGLKLEFFRLKPSILSYFKMADLVISHAGAGSCLEALGAQKLLITVINDNLMDNHQLELAQELSLQKYCVACTPRKLCETILNLNPRLLLPYKENDHSKLAKYLDNVMIEPEAKID